MKDSIGYGESIRAPSEVYVKSKACDEAIEIAKMIHEDRDWMDLKYVLHFLDSLIA